MFGIGGPELIVILIVALILIGPKKLPEIARSLGRALGEFRKTSDEIKDTFQKEVLAEEQKKNSTPPSSAPSASNLGPYGNNQGQSASGDVASTVGDQAPPLKSEPLNSPGSEVNPIPKAGYRDDEVEH